MTAEQKQALLADLRKMKAEPDAAIERLMGEEDMYFDWLFELPANEDVKEIRPAFERGDYEACENHAHTLKGVALYMNLVPLVDVCMDMVVDVRAKEYDDLEAETTAIENTFAQFVEIINKYKD